MKEVLVTLMEGVNSNGINHGEGELTTLIPMVGDEIIHSNSLYKVVGRRFIYAKDRSNSSNDGSMISDMVMVFLQKIPTYIY